MFKKYAQSVLSIVAGIVVAGVILEEAGKGTFGATVQKLANKVTLGYGV